MCPSDCVFTDSFANFAREFTWLDGLCAVFRCGEHIQQLLRMDARDRRIDESPLVSGNDSADMGFLAIGSNGTPPFYRRNLFNKACFTSCRLRGAQRAPRFLWPRCPERRAGAVAGAVTADGAGGGDERSGFLCSAGISLPPSRRMRSKRYCGGSLYVWQHTVSVCGSHRWHDRTPFCGGEQRFIFPTRL